MFGETLVIGIIITLAALVVAVVVAVLLFRRRGIGRGNSVPPPIDPGPTHPEKARDVNADK
jgi:hypothetical protein